MRSSTYTVVVVFFTGLSSASRRVANLHRAAHPEREIARSDLQGSTDNRSISHDGSCGSWSGYSCLPGFCCGSNGWCGNTAEYCGSGVCQSDFGECDIASPTETSVRLSAASRYCEMSTNTDRATAVTLTDLDSSITLVTFDRTRSTQSNLPTSTALHKSFAEGLKQSHPSDADYGSSALSDSAVKPTTFPGSSPSFPADFTPLVLHQPEQPVSNGPPQPTSFQTITSAAYQMNPSPPSAAPGGGDGVSNSGSKTYIRQYTGDGSSSMGWPSEDDWLSFETLWGINQLIMKSSCSSIYSQKNNTEQELSDVKAAILDVSASSGVNKAFILAIMLQESNACVRAPTTTHSHANPGLFQSHKGEGSCDNGHRVQSPCPKSEIYQMVKDGVEGTASGDGLRQLLAKASGDGAQRHYRAARMYNSGSVDPSGNLGLGVSTHCYCSDLANRLTGWSDGISECDAASVGA